MLVVIITIVIAVSVCFLCVLIYTVTTDLEFALRGQTERVANNADDEVTVFSPAAGKSMWTMNLVARAWDPRVGPASEVIIVLTSY